MMPDPNCGATRHGTEHAYRLHRCRCPDIVARMRRLWRNAPPKPYRRNGRRRGWSNVADVDPLAVKLVVEDGHQLRLSAGERRAAVVELTRRGWQSKEIALRLGITTRTVQRLKPAA